jgi:hypothetical protein
VTPPAYRLRSEAEQTCTDDVGSQGISAGNDQARFERVAAERTRSDHGRVSDRDSEMNRKPPGHRGDEGVHIVEESMLVLLFRSRVSVVVRRGKRHGDVLEEPPSGEVTHTAVEPEGVAVEEPAEADEIRRSLFI